MALPPPFAIGRQAKKLFLQMTQYLLEPLLLCLGEECRAGTCGCEWGGDDASYCYIESEPQSRGEGEEGEG